MKEEKVNKKAGYVCPDFEVACSSDQDLLAQVSEVFQPDKDWEKDDWYNQP